MNNLIILNHMISIMTTFIDKLSLIKKLTTL